jgi:nitrogen fixation NifU-like protein
MSDLNDLYQEMILDHGKRPRNFGKLDGANREAEGVNPLCGDQCRIYLDLEDGRLEAIRFEGQGCAISTASASLMTEAVKGLTLEDAQELFEKLHDLVTKDEAAPDSRLGKLAVFAGVRNFPLRVKCATLAWHTLLAAIKGKKEQISTEEE